MYFFQHDVGEAEIEAVSQAIRDGDLTTGNQLKKFARFLEERFRFPKVELCSSGTSALQLTLHALGVGPGDEVITTPYVGVWTPNTILMNGATPVFADIDRNTYNLDPVSVCQKVTSKTKAVLPVSVNGNPCDLDALRLAVPPWVTIVCDDIEALGSMRNGSYVGEDIGIDVSVNGFWVSKQVTTCGGGMVTSEDGAFLKKFEGLTRHGHGLVGDMWNQHFGFNAWLSDPMAAMGVVQVERFDEKQERLLKVKKMLDGEFLVLRRQKLLPGHFASEFIYLIELPDGVDKRQYSDAMAAKGIPTRPYFENLMNVPHLRQYSSSLPVVEYVSRKTIALPYHWKMTMDDVQLIAAAHTEVLSKLYKP